MASTQTPFSCGNYHGCPATLFFFCCYWSADRWCSNRCLDRMYVSLVTSYEPTKPPARVCCEIFTNMRWKQIKVTKKLFFLVRWDLGLLLSSSQIYFCPYSFDQKFATPTTLIHLSAFDLPNSALIYSECQMNRSCCLLSLWPQNRSLNYLWTFLCLDAKGYQYDDDRRDVKFHVLASQTTEQVTIQVCGCKLDNDQNKRHVTNIWAWVLSPPIKHHTCYNSHVHLLF